MNLKQRGRQLLLGTPPDVTAALVRGQLDGRGATVSPQLASPFAPSPDQLSSIVWADIHGLDYAPTTRATAMAVPAVARARNVLVRTIAAMPLISMTGDLRDETQPRWMQRTDGELHPWHRMVWTIDDLIFHPYSLWAVQRGAASDGNPILHAGRVPYHRWHIDADRQIMVDNQPVAASQCLLIPGPHGGILDDNGVAIRMAADNLRAAGNAASNPVPNIDLHYTGDDDMTPEAIQATVDLWTAQRRKATGGVGFTNKYVEARVLGSHDANLLVEGRNADAVDMARITSVPAAVVDATSAGASLTYETTEGRNQQLLDYGAQLYMDAVTARLSMDDVVASGKRTAFDTSQLTQLTPNPLGAPTDD